MSFDERKIVNFNKSWIEKEKNHKSKEEAGEGERRFTEEEEVRKK